MKHADHKTILKGVSTLDLMKKNLKAILLPAVLFLVITTALSAEVFGGHSTLDIVDPSFNPNVQSAIYAPKWVSTMRALPDGKILALGGYNRYNGAPVGKLIRLNPDGTLDPTFDNQTVTAIDIPGGAKILIQPDGKIVICSVGLVAAGQGPRHLMRLNADGTFDPTFNFTQQVLPQGAFMDALGRPVLIGDFTTPNGSRRIIRLNGSDGSLDNSFNYTPAAGTNTPNMLVQGNKPVILSEIGGSPRILRLNENGSEDATFTPLIGTQINLTKIQPDNKILYIQTVNQTTSLLRLNENGAPDVAFQTTTLTQAVNDEYLKFTSDGKFVIANSSSTSTFRRYLANGGIDPSFNQFTASQLASYTIQPDDSIVLGDGTPFNPSSSNNSIRLTPGGTPDPTYNPSGTGFQTIQPGIIQAIETYPNGKVLLGGKFDLINNVPRIRLTR